jgi:CheY-like chemotaxis protein/HPt (histidine-containing phosphotransfer) domain-containing protein
MIPAAEQFALRPLKVLLAEDSPLNQRLAVGMLNKYGHQVDVASNGREAVELCRRDENEYDVILMDVQMPEMDGLQAARLLRTETPQSGRRAPIIAMTAQAMKGDRERCMAAGMDDYVSKPIRPRELFAAIRRTLGAQAIFGAGEGEPSYDEASQAQSGRDASGLVNWEVARETVQGDQALLRKLAETALSESSALMAEMRRAIDEGDYAGVERAAHALKGQFRIFGAAVAEHVAFHIENAAADRSLEVAGSLAALERQVELMRAELRDFLGGLASQHSAKQPFNAEH